MTSALKIAANRANAAASTGPKTQEGKFRAAYNARRHGLSVPISTDPLLSKQAEQLAQSLVGPAANTEVLAAARRVAEAQIDLVRIRRIRCDLLVKKIDDPDFSPRLSAISQRRTDKLLQFVSRWPDSMAKPFRETVLSIVNQKPKAHKKMLIVTDEITREFVAFNRYERRAISRRKFAVRDFDAACMRAVSDASAADS